MSAADLATQRRQLEAAQAQARERFFAAHLAAHATDDPTEYHARMAEACLALAAAVGFLRA